MEHSWRSAILKEFQPELARLTLASDPHGLLLDEELLRELEEKGFDLIPFDDPIRFRYAYEDRYRSHWDRGKALDLVVVLRSGEADLRSLPFDLLQSGRTLSFSLGDIFPRLNLPVVEGLDRAHLDALYRAQTAADLPGVLGRRQTQGFVLRHVFKIAPETISTETDLLRLLLERHHKRARIPAGVERHLVHELRKRDVFPGWPLERLITDRATFLDFLQERWPVFLDRLTAEGTEGRESQPRYALEVPGPETLPFDHDDVRVYVDNFFVEGLLTPVKHEGAAELDTEWIRLGVYADPTEDHRRRWTRLHDAIASSIPAGDALHTAWLELAPRWGRLLALLHEPAEELDPAAMPEFKALQRKMDEAFLAWMRDRYSALHNQPPVPPVMIHHVPRFLARRKAEGESKVALLVLDGLSWDQWVVIREEMHSRGDALSFNEGAIFAWIPTTTPVSRQACFSGDPPYYFPSTIDRTDAEPKQWQRFWDREGVSGEGIGYAKRIRVMNDLERVRELIDHPKNEVLGLVVDQVDQIMHGMKLGTAGMHNQVRQWAKGRLLGALLELLLEHGYEVFIASDHGNIEARGCGRPSEGAIAESRGERVRIYPDETLRDRVAQDYPDAVQWPRTALPERYFPLLAPGRTAFVSEGDTVVAHGGVTVEEAIVPFIEVRST